MNMETRLEAMIKDLEALISEMENEQDFSNIPRLKTSLIHLKDSKEKMNTALDILRKKINVLCRRNENRAHCLAKTILFEYLSKGDKDAVPYTEVSFRLGETTYRTDILTKIRSKWNIIEIETRIHSPQGEKHIKDMTKLRNNLTDVRFPHAGAPDIEDLKEKIRNGEAIFHVGYTEPQIDDFFVKTIKDTYGKQINLNLFFVDTENKTVTEL